MKPGILFELTVCSLLSVLNSFLEEDKEVHGKIELSNHPLQVIHLAAIKYFTFLRCPSNAQINLYVIVVFFEWKKKSFNYTRKMQGMNKFC